jgi:hypothetical protein
VGVGLQEGRRHLTVPLQTADRQTGRQADRGAGRGDLEIDVRMKVISCVGEEQGSEAYRCRWTLEDEDKEASRRVRMMQSSEKRDKQVEENRKKSRAGPERGIYGI